MSYENKHTSGPWMQDEDRPFDILFDDRDGENVTPIIASVHTDNTDPAQWQADACLIAAAPEMLAMLEAQRSVLTGLIRAEYNVETWDLRPSLAALDAVIAKARGAS